MKRSALKKLSSYKATELQTPSASGLAVSKLVKIGEAAKLLGISIDTLRRWEKRGWLRVTKTPGGTRLYDKEQLSKLNPNLRKGPKSLLTPLAPIQPQPRFSGSGSSVLHEGKQLETKIHLNSDEPILKISEYIKPHQIESDIVKSFSQIEKSISSHAPLIRLSSKSWESIKNNIQLAVITLVIMLPLLLLAGYLNSRASSITSFSQKLSPFSNNTLLSSANLLKELAGIFSPTLSHALYGNYPAGSPPGFFAKLNTKSQDQLASGRVSGEIKGKSLSRSTGSVLADSTPSGSFLQINLDTQINGSLSVNTATVSGALYSATINTGFGDNEVYPMNQPLLTTSPVTFATLTAGSLSGGTLSLTSTSNQITLANTIISTQTGGSGAFTVSIPALTSNGNFVIDNAVQTLTNKTISGSSNTFESIPNSALSSSSITINAGSGLSGGGEVSLGGSITLTATGGSSSGVSSITGTADQVIASASTGDITLSLPQSIATTSSPEFANLALSDLDANGVVFTTGAGLLDTVTTVSTGECLLSNGAGAPTWGSCFSGSTSFTLAGDSGPNQSISSGDTLTINGDSNIATLGVDTDHFSITLASALTGITSIDTIAVSSTSLTFAGAGTISSTTSSAITLDSGTTGTVNLGTGNNAKTINLGTGNAGNTINIGTDNTIADAINIGSALDTTIITGTTRLAGLTTNGPIYTSGGNGTLNSEAQLAVSRGGTGQDFSSIAQGSLPYFSATGTFSALAPSTAGYVLTTQGAGADPTWTDTGSLTVRWNTIDDPNGNQTLAMADYTTTWNWATADTETAFSATANALTSGTLFNLSSTSTAGTDSGNSFLLDLSRSGTNSNSSHTAYGIRSQVTNTGTTSTNIAGYFSASGATTNYALYAPSGYSYFGDSVGIGSNAPSQTSKLAVVTTGLATTLDVTNNNTGSTAYGTRITKSGAATTGVGLYVTSSGATNNYAAIFDAGRVGIGDTTPDSLFDFEGAISGTPSSTGAWLNYTGSTFTDSATSGSGTATTFAANAFGQPTLAATNSNVTTTNAATVYIANAPATGSNQTITAPLALLVDSGAARFDGHVGIGSGYNNAAVSSTSVLGISEAYTGSSSFRHVNLFGSHAPASDNSNTQYAFASVLDLHSSATASLTGTVTAGLFQITNSNATQSIGTAFGSWIGTATSSGGAITNNYGLFIDDQTVGSSDYGLRIDAADTQTLWVGGGANGTTASAGIAFGSSRDTNLYRSAADTLKTDDAFTATGLITGSTGLTITGGTASINASGSSSTTIGNTSSDLTLTGNHINASMTLTDTSSGAKNGLSSTISLNPSGSSASQFRANSFSATVSSGNVQDFTDVIRGVYAETRHLGTGSINIATGVFSAGVVLPTAATSFGTITEINAFHALPVSEFASSAITGTVSTARGIYIENSAKANSSWAMTTQVGIDVSAMTSGSSDIGVRIAGADTYSLQLSSTAGTAASGITFGTDTNLYRSAADTLKTDDAFNVNGNLNITSAGAISAATGITSSGTITFSGLSADSGVYTTTGGQLTTTPPSSGTLGYWSRTGTTLSTANSGDDVALTSVLSTGAKSSYSLAISQANDGTFNNSVGLLSLANSDTGSTAAVANISQAANGVALAIDLNTGGTSSKGISFSGGLTGMMIDASTVLSTSGVQVNLAGHTQTSGSALRITGNASSYGTDFSGSLILVNPTRTLATAGATRNESGNYLKIARSNTVNNGTATINMTGSVADLSSNCTQTLGTCNDSSNILSLTQSYASATGSVLAISNSGSAASILLPGTNSTASGLQFGSDGNSVNLYRSANDTLKTDDAFNVNGNLNITSAGAISAATGITSSGTITFSGLSADSGVYTTTGGQLTTTPPSSGTLGYWSRTGSTLSPANAGDAITTSGNISTSGSGTISSAGLLSGTAGLTITGATASLNASSNFNTNINTGTSTGAISIGNSSAGAIALSTGSTFGVTTTTGSQTFTSANLTGTTTSSSYVFNSSSLTSGTALYVSSTATSGKTVDINASQTSGTVFNLAYGSAKTLTGDLTGLSVDLNSGNVDATNQNITGVNFKIPTVTDTHTSGTKTLTGMLVNFGSGAGINQNGAGGTLEYVAGDFYMPALTQTAGTLNAYGTRVNTPSTITTGGTAYGNYVSATGVGAGTLSGLGVSSITGGAGTEYALNIGSGWDAVLRVGSTTVINGSGVTVEAGGGTGQSTYSTGDLLYASGANTLAKRAIGNSNEVLTVVGGVPTWATISGSSCSNCVITDPTSDQTIAPTGQGTTGLIVRQTSTASPTDDIFQITSSDGATKYFYVDKDGNVSTSSTSGQTLTLTPLTDTTALTLVGTNVSSQPLQYVNSKNSSATSGIINMAYGAAQTLTGSVIGIRTDLSTNVTATNQSVTGYQITLPGATNTSGTQAYKGIVISGGSINENGGTATTFTGADITIPALTQTSGTLTAYGANITTPSSITTAGTAYGVNIAATGVGAGSLYGVNVSDISAGAGTEVGMQIGSGWDTNLLFNDTTTRVAVADGGTITILDTAGNSLCTITDNGSVGDLECTGTIGGSGTVGFWSRDAGTGIVSPSNANDVVAISSNKTSTPLLNLTSTGATSNAFTLTGNSITTGNLASLTGTGFTTGEILDITGTWAPSDGSTNEAIDINITHTPTSLADNFTGLNLQVGDGSALNNTVHGGLVNVNSTGNAAKTMYGFQSGVQSSSTTADTLTSLHAWGSITGAITTGTRSIYGVASPIASTAASTGGTQRLFGGYFSPSSTLSNPGTTDTTTNNIYGVYTSTTLTLASDCTTNCTSNQYGLYVDNGSSDTDGTSTKYGIYISTQSGADTNYALYSAATAASYFAGNVGIGTTPSGAYRAQVSRSITSSDNSYDGNLSASATVSSVTDGYTYVGLNNYLTSTHSSNAATLRGIDAKAYFSSQMASEATVGVNSAYAIYAEKGITGSSPTGTISNAFGLHSAFYSSATGTPAVTISNNYGLYITNQGTPSGSPSGISVGNAIGLYVAAQSGATSTNYAAVFAGGNVGIGDTSPASALTVGSGDLFQVNSSGAIAAVTGYTQASGAFAFSGGGNFSIDSAAFDVNTSGAISGVTTLTQSGLHTINQGSAIRSIDINDTAASPSTPVIDVNRTNNTGTPAITNAALYINDHSTNYLLGFETGTTDLLTFTGAGQLSLPVSGSGAGIILGGDANLYRSAADTLRTDDAFNVGGNFNVTAAGVISGATGLTSSGTINFSGLSASSGVYTDSSKNLTSTPPSSGTIGYWSRSGTALSPATAGDVVLLDNNTAYQMKDTGGVARSLVSLNSSDMQTFGIVGYNATYNGYSIDITSALPSGQTTSSAFDIKSSSDLGSSDELVQFGDSAGDFLTILGGGNVGIGDTSPDAALEIVNTTTPQLRIGYDDTTNYFTGAVSSAGAVTFNTNGSGPQFNFSDRVDVAAYLSLDNGDFAGSRGLRFRDASDTGSTLTGGGLYQANNDTVYLQAGDSNNIIMRNGSGADQVILTASSLNLDASGLDLLFPNEESISNDTNGVINFLMNNTTSALQIGSTGITSIGNVAHSIVDSSGALNIDSNSTGAINIGTGANAKTITVGNNTGATALAFTSGTGSQTFTSSVATTSTTSSAFVFTANSLTSGTGAYVSSSSITTGKLFQLSTGSANTLSSGTLADIRTTSTALTGSTGTGSLLNLDWSPGSSTTATGDLFSLNIGSNGSTTGKLFNILDSSSSIFSVSETSFTTSLPSNFTAAGDTSIAYDLNFTNPTASYIESIAPLYLVAGETFNSSNLNLQTYNFGSVVVDSALTTGTGTKYNFQSTLSDATANANFLYGVYSTVNNSSNTSSGTHSIYGGYFSATSKTTGTTTAIGVYGTASGGDNNFPFYSGVAFPTANTAGLCWDNSGESAIYDCNGTPTDLAENYGTSDSSIEAGDVVAFTGEAQEVLDPREGKVTTKAFVKKSNSQYQNDLVGIVSTNPNQTYGEDGLFSLAENPRPVSLTGRVPVKVSTENGPIAAGDYLTSSSTPGVAMKSTQPGVTIGRALSSYTGSGVGKVIVYVKTGFADPNEALANLLIGNNGQLLGSELNLQKITVATTGTFGGLVSANNFALNSDLINKSGALASVPVSADNKVNIADTVNALNSELNTLDSRLSTLDSNQASQSAQLAEARILGEQAVNHAQSLDEKVASTSANLSSLSSRIDELLASISGSEPQSTGSGDLDLTPPSELIATDSATFTNLDITENLSTLNIEAMDATISSTLKSLGETFLGQTTIAGDLSVDGTMSFTNGNSINAFPTLFFQNNPLASAVDFFNSKITLDKDGLFSAEAIALGDQSLGDAVIYAGQTEVTIPTSIIKSDSKIFLTPTSPISGNIYVGQIVEGSGFKVKISQPNLSAVEFNWMIVQAKD